MKEENEFFNCCNAGDFDKVKYFIESGIDVNVKNFESGWAPLHYAAIYGNYDNVKYLIKVNVVPKDDSDGFSPLFLAVFSKNIKNILKIVSLLINHGAEINYRNNRGETVLHYVFFNSYIDDKNTIKIIEYLEKNGLKIDGTTYNRRETLLRLATHFKGLSVIR